MYVSATPMTLASSGSGTASKDRDAMRHFPLFLDLRDRPVLVVGGGEAAARKAVALAETGARVTILAERPCADAQALTDTGRVALLRRGFRKADAPGNALIVSATDSAGEDASVSAAARAAGVPVNVVDRPALCTFLWPAIVDRDPVTVAIGSAGAAPLLARSVRAHIEAMLPSRLGALARFAEEFRGAVKATRTSGRARRRFWERFFDGPVAISVLAGDERGAREQMLSLLNRHDDAADRETGVVHLVGAGPGDPDLLTIKALRLLQEADVVVHDRLIGPAILDYARRDAERIDVGKAPGRRARTQAQINDLLLCLAQAGKRVVRLKGGDPFVFGRGGEERAHLVQHGVRVEVVPGITAVTGCAASAGIPLTRRGTSQALTILTARGRDDSEPEIDWRACARDGQTLAVYMGAAAAGRIATKLIAHGRDPETPTAILARGTLADEQVRAGPLRDLERMARATGRGPMLILIGEVVRESDAWATREITIAAVDRAGGRA